MAQAFPGKPGVRIGIVLQQLFFIYPGAKMLQDFGQRDDTAPAFPCIRLIY